MRRSARNAVGIAATMALIALAIVAPSPRARPRRRSQLGSRDLRDRRAAPAPTASPPTQFFTQAAGHPPIGVTDFVFNATVGGPTAKAQTSPGRTARGSERQPAGGPAVSECDLRSERSRAARRAKSGSAKSPPRSLGLPIGRCRSPSTTSSRTKGEPALFGFHVGHPVLIVDQRVRLPRNRRSNGRATTTRASRSTNIPNFPAAGREPARLQRHHGRQFPHPAEPVQRRLDLDLEGRIYRSGRPPGRSDDAAGADRQRLRRGAVRADRHRAASGPTDSSSPVRSR